MDIGFISGGSGIRELVNLTREQLSVLVQTSDAGEFGYTIRIGFC